MTANGFSSYEVFVKLGSFKFTLRLTVLFFCRRALFHFQALKNMLKGILCSDLRSQLLFSYQDLTPCPRGRGRGARALKGLGPGGPGHLFR